MADYTINGKGVGHDPESFQRSAPYQDFFKRIGDNTANIRRIKNFIKPEDAKLLIATVNASGPVDTDGQWSGMIWNNPETNAISNQYALNVISAFKTQYSVDCQMCGGNYIVKWETGKSMDLHVDDLGSGENHISAVLYLNEGYEGGEIVFPTHDLTIEPEAYELIMFPGNLNYAHEVKPIANGTRFTLPVWAEIV